MIASNPEPKNVDLLDKKFRQYLKQIGALVYIKKKHNLLNDEKFEKSIVQIKNKHSSKKET